jgi:hypothetical protein
VWSFGKGGVSMLHLFFSSQCFALSTCSLQRSLLKSASTKAIDKEDVRSLDMLATSPAMSCRQPIKRVDRVVFRHKWFRKSSSCPFKSGFMLHNQSASNVTSVTTKTAFFSIFLVAHVGRVGFLAFLAKTQKIAEMPFNVLSQSEGL